MEFGIEESPNRFASELFDGLPPRYDGLANILSFGQDRRWRKELVRRIRENGPTGLILDVATGPGGVAIALRSSTGADVVGLDLTATMLDRAQQNLVERNEHGIYLIQGRGEQLPFAKETFDAVSFTYLLRYVKDPAETLEELTRVLRPGGVLATLEFYVPPIPLWNILWLTYTRFILPVAGWLTGGNEWFVVGRFLGPSISNFYRRYPLPWMINAWRRAGIESPEVRVMSLGGGVVIWGRKSRELQA